MSGWDEEKDCKRRREDQESVKIIKEVEGRCNKCCNANRMAYSSAIRMVASLGRQTWCSEEGKRTAKPVPWVDLDPSV